LSHHNELFKFPVLENVEYGPDVARLEGDDIIFTDGRVVHADIILLATGYRLLSTGFINVLKLVNSETKIVKFV